MSWCTGGLASVIWYLVSESLTVSAALPLLTNIIFTCIYPLFYDMIISEKLFRGGDIMSKHIVTINQSSLQDSIKFEGCSECQTSCQSACKTSCTIGNLICTTQEEAKEAKRA